MTIEEFAGQFRLRITRDECGDKIIQGKRGHLYFAEGLCLMVKDGVPAKKSSWAALGGELWIGATSPGKAGRRVQDVWIKGIPLENAQAAIKMAQCHQKRVLSAPEVEARRGRMLKARESLSKRPSPALESRDQPPPVRKLG